MKFGQLKEYNVKNISFKHREENEGWRLVPDLFLFVEKASKKDKANDQHLSFNLIW